MAAAHIASLEVMPTRETGSSVGADAPVAMEAGRHTADRVYPCQKVASHFLLLGTADFVRRGCEKSRLLAPSVGKLRAGAHGHSRRVATCLASHAQPPSDTRHRWKYSFVGSTT